MLHIIIPMAGRGVRFRQQGFIEPKPLLPVFGKPMILRVLQNLVTQVPHQVTLVHSELTISREKLEIVVQDFPARCRILTLNKETEGALITVLEGTAVLDGSDELVVANSDQLVSFNFDDFLIHARRNLGSLLTFTATDPRWSFVETDALGRVIKVAEKQPISDEATVGIYYFQSISRFRSGAHKMIAANDRVNGEFYVAPVYNWLPSNEGSIRTYRLQHSGAMYGLGTPEDYRAFLAADPMGLGT